MTREEYETLLDKEGVTIIKFYADWCQPCKLLAPALNESCNRHGIELISLNVDDEDNVGIAKLFDVRSVPFTIRLEDGRVDGTMQGAMGEQYVDNFVKGS